MKLKIAFQITLLVLISMLCEVFIFNYKTFFMALPQGATYKISEVIDSSQFELKEDGTYVSKVANPYIEIKNINLKTKTIYFDADDLNGYRVVSRIQFKDATRAKYYHDTDTYNAQGVTYPENTNLIFEIFDGSTKSKYKELDLFGETIDLKITVSVGSGSVFRFGDIKSNDRIPFHASYLRTVLLFSLMLSIYLFVMLFKYRDKVKENKALNIGLKAGITFIALGVVVFIYGYIYGNFSDFMITNGSQISQELVDMIKAKQVSLLMKPSAKLKDLANPYGPQERYGVSYAWDHLYYNGKYYSYYGLTPVFMLFLPFNLITGKYLNDCYGVLLFSLIGTLFTSLVYFKLQKKYFKDLPLAFSLAGFVILFASCGILNNLTRPYFYEVSTSCGNMCMMIALYFMIKANLITKEEKLRPVMLGFASLFMGLAVLARPTFVLFAVVFALYGVVRVIQDFKISSGWKNAFNIMMLVLPIGLLAGMQCVYNYLRFGSLFEFGIKYSLTINDFTRTEPRFNLMLNSIYNFLFAVPSYKATGWFIEPHAQFFHTGYYFSETYDAIGLFYRVPVILLVFLLPFTVKDKSWKEKGIWIIKYFVPLFVIPFVLVMLTWESGFATRYYSDFAWAMVLLGLFVFFYYYEKNKDNRFARRMLGSIIFVMMFHAAATSIAQILFYVPSFNYQLRYYKAARELAFWR